jgi:hypothetical protein
VYGLNFPRALHFDVGDYLILLPRTLIHVARARVGVGAVAASVAVGLCVVLRLLRAPRGESVEFRRDGRRLVYAGVAAYTLGYAIFFTSRNMMHTAAGMGNRVVVAAGLGVAVGVVGMIAWLASLPPFAHRATPIVATALASLAASYVFVLQGIGSYWVDSFTRERAVIAAIERRVPSSPGGALLLAGVCPYLGPAPVFESNWDLQGALLPHFRDPKLRVDVVTERVRVLDDRIRTTSYAVVSEYPFAELVVYDFATDSRLRFANGSEARGFLTASIAHCPKARQGAGVRLF